MCIITMCVISGDVQNVSAVVEAVLLSISTRTGARSEGLFAVGMCDACSRRWL